MMPVPLLGLWVPFAPLTLIGFLLFGVALLMGLRFFIRLLFRRTRRRMELVWEVVRWCFILLLIASSVGALYLSAFWGSYRTFTRMEWAASVRCHEVPGDPFGMVLEYTPVISGKRGDPQVFELRGDQWALGGHIVKWGKALHWLGLESGHKITWVGSRYLNAEGGRTRERTVYRIADSRWEGVWRWLYRYASSLPFVDAAYVNTAYTFPSGEMVWNVYVSTSDFFMVKENEPPPEVWNEN